MADKREKLTIKTNFKYQLRLLRDEPITGDNEFGTWYLYPVVVVKTPEGDDACITGQEYSWFASEYVNDLIAKIGAKKGCILDVWSEQDGKKVKWHIAPVVRAISPKSKPQTSGDPGPPEPPPERESKAPAPEKAEKVNRVEGPKPSAPPYQKKPGWTPESIAEEVEWWCNKCAGVITEYAKAKVDMPPGEICKFHNTGLIQSLKIGPKTTPHFDPTIRICDLPPEQQGQHADKFSETLELFAKHDAEDRFRAVLQKSSGGRSDAIGDIRIADISDIQDTLKLEFVAVKTVEAVETGGA